MHVLYEATACMQQVYAAGVCNLLCIPKSITNLSWGTRASESHFSLCASVSLHESKGYVFDTPQMNR